MKAVVSTARKGTRIKGVMHGTVLKELLPIVNVLTIIFPKGTIILAGIKDVLYMHAKTKYNVSDALKSVEFSS